MKIEKTTCIDEQGNKYGRLLVITRAGSYKRNNKCLALWNCVCDCGNNFVALGSELRSGHTKSCGCLKLEMAINNCKQAANGRIGTIADNNVNEIGNVYGRLTVIEQLPTKHHKARWLCKCICSKQKRATGDSLRSGKVTSCGCARKDIKNEISITSVAVKFAQYKANALRRGIEFLISKELFENIISKNCSYCGGLGGGIDRFDNNLGYIESNVVPCCKICNRMKLTQSAIDFLNHCIKVVENHKKLTVGANGS